jgi:hypothetical protein
MDDTKQVGMTGLDEPSEASTDVKAGKRTAARRVHPKDREPGNPASGPRSAKPGDRSWRYAGAAFFAVVAIWVMIQVPGWITNMREKRIQKAVDTVTPERLLTRCGQPVEDVSKEVFPVIERTISYKPWGQGKVLFAFSRTSEEKSDWVFLSMKNEAGDITYNTPDEQIAALPCLDSRR